MASRTAPSRVKNCGESQSGKIRANPGFRETPYLPRLLIVEIALYPRKIAVTDVLIVAFKAQDPKNRPFNRKSRNTGNCRQKLAETRGTKNRVNIPGKASAKTRHKERRLTKVCKDRRKLVNVTRSDPPARGMTVGNKIVAL